MSAFPASASMDVSALNLVSKPVVVAVAREDDKAAMEAALGSKATVIVADYPVKLAALVGASAVVGAVHALFRSPLSL
eukprot:7182768-Pyramimonas_sp.AAC.1